MKLEGNWLIRGLNLEGIMQTLQREFKNVPTDASLVCSSTSRALNREETLSAHGKVLICNNPEVNQPQQGGDSNLRVSNKVFVLSMSGKTLMPCKPQKAKKLLKGGKANVVKRFPFTIRLTMGTGETVQDINLGIDSGYKHVGFSSITEKEELFSGTLDLDLKTKDRLNEKKMYRRNRRNKLRYRKSRFNNRKRKDNWLPPSIERKYQTHLTLIEKIKNLLPIKNVIVEVAKFDIQKIMNPEINGKEYQQGNLFDYQNMVSYLQVRQNNICPYCKKEFKGEPKATHHIYRHGDSRRSNRPDGLLLLHKSCHVDLHEKHREKEFQKPVKRYEPSTFMSIIHKRFYEDITGLQVTYGYITQMKRNEYNIEKTHFNDAFIIAGGTQQVRCKPIIIEQRHRNNRVLQLNRKGFKPSIKRERSKILPKDLFWSNNIKYTCKGMFNKGKYVLFGDSKKKEYIKFTLIDKIYNFGSFVWNI